MAKFIKGVSGNPKGRPRGSRSKFTKYKTQVAKAMPDILDAMIKLAKGGDVTAARVLMARMWPENAQEVESMEKLITELSERVEQLQLRSAA